MKDFIEIKSIHSYYHFENFILWYSYVFQVVFKKEKLLCPIYYGSLCLLVLMMKLHTVSQITLSLLKVRAC